ncbi:MAG TPA: class 1 fructose-bisphosphatase [Candidatus Methylomirabilis sp.]|nr:class 1 fructose-bisphosphatase [Candidatus Methylomirabilis sp.]
MSTRAITLNRHILEEERLHPGAAGELTELLVQLGYAAKILAREIGRAALVGRLGLVGEKNATGDSQKKLDVFANDTVVEAFAQTGLVAGVVSEELDEVKQISCEGKAKYILCVDPLDGSSNTDINGALGTIFGIYRRDPAGGGDQLGDVLRQKAAPVAAGYVMYGTSTILAYTCGHGVAAFTLDRDLGEFLLSQENIRCPARGRTYSANVARMAEWHPDIRRFIQHITQTDPATDRPYSLRYSGALVGDVHRCLIEGGLYFYPPDPGHPDGKLRLVYECAPLAALVEAAGGRASDGARRILDIGAETIHQRVPLVIGSAGDVALYEAFLRGESS